MCANSGGVQLNALYKKICFGVDGSHSSPRITCVISIKWSSTTFARWYVGKPSDFTRTWSSIIFPSKETVPRIRSLNFKFS